MLVLELTNHNGHPLVWIEGYPTICILPDGELEVVSPNGWTIYSNNKEFIDEWLETQGYKHLVDEWWLKTF